jgi:putative ABC transport system substrate-binding protein
MRRRDFIAACASAAAVPFAANAQQASLPVVGYLGTTTPRTDAIFLAAFRSGLGETGFTEGRNVTIDYRFAENVTDRLPELASDLIRRGVRVIATSTVQATLAAKAATVTIPIVFRTASDPVRYNLIESFSRPGSNLTGINTAGADFGAKRLQLLHDLLPGASRFALLVDPQNIDADSRVPDVQAAAAAIGRPVDILPASTNREIDAAFVSCVQLHIDGIVVANGALLLDRRVQIVTLATYHHLPAIYGYREAAEIGGLMSYGPDQADSYRLAGVYTGRILKGEKPSDLPVMRPTKFDFVLNVQTARTLGINVPPGLLAIADEVIE